MPHVSRLLGLATDSEIETGRQATPGLPALTLPTAGSVWSSFLKYAENELL